MHTENIFCFLLSHELEYTHDPNDNKTFQQKIRDVLRFLGGMILDDCLLKLFR